MIHFSVFLNNAWLYSASGGSLQQLLNSGKIYVFSGPIPATADVAVDPSAVSLVTVANAGAGVTFANTPSNGVLQKTAAETWSGTVIAAGGTAAFYRYCVGTDTGSAASAAGNYRVQGTIGIDASFDLIVGSTALAGSSTFTINTYQLQIAQ